MNEPLRPLLTPCTLRSQLQIRWDLVSEAVPAFVTIAVMPLTYSIAYGVPGVCASRVKPCMTASMRKAPCRERCLTVMGNLNATCMAPLLLAAVVLRCSFSLSALQGLSAAS